MERIAERFTGNTIMMNIQLQDSSIQIANMHELEKLIGGIGFFPLFRNCIPGFSLEEHTIYAPWWSGDPHRDPWEWRMTIASEHKIAYGKFFSGKAGFISSEWLPAFCNSRRNGYDFDALWDDELASFRQKRIMDCFSDKEELFSFQLKRMAGFDKQGEKNFEGTISSLQQKLYLVDSDFRRRQNRYGIEYGWHIAKYAMPEKIWGYEYITSEYSSEPADSYDRIRSRITEVYPQISETGIRFLAGERPQ